MDFGWVKRETEGSQPLFHRLKLDIICHQLFVVRCQATHRKYRLRLNKYGHYGYFKMLNIENEWCVVSCRCVDTLRRRWNCLKKVARYQMGGQIRRPFRRVYNALVYCFPDNIYRVLLLNYPFFSTRHTFKMLSNVHFYSFGRVRAALPLNIDLYISFYYI